MPINPLDPSRPLLADPVLITEELRAIKGRLLTDATDIEALKAISVSLNNTGPFGLSMLEADTLANAETLLAQGSVGKTLFNSSDLTATKAYLGIVAQTNPTISQGTNTTCITLPGGVKINTFNGNLTPGITYSWQIPFSTLIFGFANSNLDGNDNNFTVNSINNSGFTVTYNGGQPRYASVIAIGI